MTDDRPDAKTAILALLREIEATPERAISLYDIGVPLVAKGYEQDAIYYGLRGLESDGVITILEASNALRLTKPL